MSRCDRSSSSRRWCCCLSLTLVVERTKRQCCKAFFLLSQTNNTAFTFSIHTISRITCCVQNDRARTCCVGDCHFLGMQRRTTSQRSIKILFPPTCCGLEELIFILLSNLIVHIVFIGVSKNFILNLLGLGLCNLVLLLTLLRLSLDLSLGGLNFFVLEDIARFDDILNGCIVKDVFALLNNLLDKEGSKGNISTFL